MKDSIQQRLYNLELQLRVVRCNIESVRPEDLVELENRITQLLKDIEHENYWNDPHN